MASSPLQNSTCPSGTGPDLLYRFPMEPFFPEPYGSDCGYSFLGAQIWGALIVATSVLGLVLTLATFPEPESRLFTLVRVVHCMDYVLICAVVITCWVDLPRAYIPAVIFTAFFMYTGLMWLFLGYHTVVKTVINVQLKKDVTVYTLLGGKVKTALFLFNVAVIHVGVVIAVAALAICLSQGNIPGTVISYRVSSGLIGLGCLQFAIAAWIALSKFLKIVKTSLQSSLKENQSDHYKANLEDIIHRFTTMRTVFTICALGAAVLEVLLMSVLPLFWYIMFLVLGVAATCALVLLFAITSSKKRKALKARLLYCRRTVEVSASSSAVAASTAHATGNHGGGTTGDVEPSQAIEPHQAQPEDV